jgi:hypothetical protein
MPRNTESGFHGSDARRLRVARERAYLDARCPTGELLARAHGLWCWKLKIPIVWLERRSRWSRYGRVKLDLLTTPNVLTGAGFEALERVAALSGPRVRLTISPHAACIDFVPKDRLAEVARALYRAAVNSANYRVNRPSLVRFAPQRAGVRGPVAVRSLPA